VTFFLAVALAVLAAVAAALALAAALAGGDAAAGLPLVALATFDAA